MYFFFIDKFQKCSSPPGWLSVVCVSDSWPGGYELDTWMKQSFFLAYFRLSPLKHVRKVVGSFGKKVVLVLVWESHETHVRHRPPWYDLSCLPVTRQQNFRLVETETNCRRHFKVLLTLAQTRPCFYVSAVKVFWKHCGKRRNCSNEQFLLFPLFSTLLENFLPFSPYLKLSSANSFGLEESEICRLGKG